MSDDGAACAPGQIGKPGGLRVINMRERVLQLNATFEFDGEPGRGTTNASIFRLTPVGVLSTSPYQLIPLTPVAGD